jgi:HlyD family secretion protein
MSTIIRRRKSLIAILLVAIVAMAAFFIYRDAFAAQAPAFRFVTVQKGDLQSKVSATGTLNAVTTISVGTQVSGQVSGLMVDFNDQVKKGQLLARIDPTLAQQAVTDAQAGVDKARAQLVEMTREYDRNRELLNAGLVARSAYDLAQSSQSEASAGLRSAQVALDKARQNLSYTNIYSPIDGVIIERDVQQGQTVAASLATPQIFLIANDLTHMQILAQVAENDIAQIKEGQEVSFTVQALPSQAFKGVVKQVRLQSTTTDNVVDYTVVVAVDNPKGSLLPGMTARADFLTKSATDILEVSNAALRFKPTEEQFAELGAQKHPKAQTTTATQTATSMQAGGGARSRGANGGQRQGNGATIYYLDANGKLASTHVRTGISDGTFTQIEGRNITAGMKLISGTASATTTQSAQTSGASPFGSSSSQQQRGSRPGGF